VPPSFFNSREDALLVWTAVILAYAIYRSPREIGRSLLAVVRALVVPKVLVLYIVAFGYSASLVYAATRIGIWHEAALKETIYWFVGTAVVLVGQAVISTEDSPSLARRVIGRVLAITVFVEFAGNLYAFPLGVELPLHS
jgi:hypothetical protein